MKPLRQVWYQQGEEQDFPEAVMEQERKMVNH
jgi:hypothetical protein